ncbi:histidine--tRNA ligase [Planctomycetota bacterium]
MRLQHPRGTFDILPEDVSRWQELESRISEVMAGHGFSEIRTPIFEVKNLFARSVGETSDIVEKEMYCFGGEQGDEYALRPERTAGVVRAYLQHNLDKIRPRQKWYYLGPNFRHERPQKGRFRQHHQVGVEYFGCKSPKADAEIVAVLADIYKAAGIDRYELVINTLGDRQCCGQYRQVLQDYLEPKLDQLCRQCQVRFGRNIYRVLDCKNEDCRELTHDIPGIYHHLNEECKRDYDEWKELLSVLDIPFREDPRLVRGLDYYSKAVFEFISEDLGAQASIGGGGRYDALLQDLGGPDIGATGFGSGLERILMVQQVTQPGFLDRPKLSPRLYFVIVPGDQQREMSLACYHQVLELRRQGICADMEYEQRSLKAQMRAADKCGADFAAVLGPDEFACQKIKLKEFATRREILVPLGGLASAIQKIDDERQKKT